MTRAVYLLGAPGVGKTTLMRELKRPYLVGEAGRVREGSLLWVTPLFTSDALAGVELGRERQRFGGTDALGMAVMPHAREWVREARLPELVLGEGARLGTVTFLGELATRTDLLVVHLDAEPDTLAARRILRGSNQDPGWVRGATSRARNAARGLEQRGVPVLWLDATDANPVALAGRIEEAR